MIRLGFECIIKRLQIDYDYRVYSNETQAKKIITIARFSGKGCHLLH